MKLREYFEFKENKNNEFIQQFRLLCVSLQGMFTTVPWRMRLFLWLKTGHSTSVFYITSTASQLIMHASKPKPNPNPNAYHDIPNLYELFSETATLIKVNTNKFNMVWMKSYQWFPTWYTL